MPSIQSSVTYAVNPDGSSNVACESRDRTICGTVPNGFAPLVSVTRKTPPEATDTLASAESALLVTASREKTAFVPTLRDFAFGYDA